LTWHLTHGCSIGSLRGYADQPHGSQSCSVGMSLLPTWFAQDHLSRSALVVISLKRPSQRMVPGGVLATPKGLSIRVKLTRRYGAHERIDNSNLSKHVGGEKNGRNLESEIYLLESEITDFAAVYKGLSLSLKPQLARIEPRTQPKDQSMFGSLHINIQDTTTVCSRTRVPTQYLQRDHGPQSIYM